MKIIKFMKTYILKHKKEMSWFILLNLVLWVMSILTPFIVGDYIDSLVNLDEVNVIWVTITALAIIWTLQIALSYFRNIIGAKVNTLISFSVNFDLLEHLKRLPLQYFTGKDPAYINSRVSSDSGNVTGFVLGSVLGLVTTILTFSFSLAIMFFLNFSMTLIICLIFPIYILIYIKFRESLYEMGYKLAEESNAFFSTKNKQLANIKLIKQNAWGDQTKDELKVEFSSLFKTTMKNARLGYIFNNVDAIVRYMANMIIYIYSGFQIMSGYMTIGQFTMINSYSLMVISSLSVFLGFGKSYRNSLVAYNRIREIYDVKQEENGVERMGVINSISIENLSFYFNDKLIIENLNVEMKKGNIYAIVGENGSGKSTLLDVLIGLQQNYIGEIKYNSTNLREIDVYNLRKNHIAIVEQEPSLYFNTIKENTNSNSDNRDMVDYWIGRLGLWDLVTTQTKNYVENNTENKNNNHNKYNDNYDKKSALSGGEKQRIEIARALIKNTNILIMDEPNSALDNDNLQLLCKIILELKYDKLIIIVTHNQELVGISDFVIKLS